MKSLFCREISPQRMIILTAFWLMLFGNAAFYGHLLQDYPLTLKNSGFLVSVLVGFFGFTVILLSLLCHKHTLKPVLIAVLLISSGAAYFMDTYRAVIDELMLQNVFSTNMSEAADLFSITLLLYLFFLGVVPALFVFYAEVKFRPWWREILSRLKLIGIILPVMALLALTFSDFYGSFFREHKEIRQYFNPGNYLYAAFKYGRHLLPKEEKQLKKLGLDATIPEGDKSRELIIMVVGETARADRFSLNGYHKKTNPLLEKENVVSLRNFWSCGTSTAVSVPCMFSNLGAAQYDKERAEQTENVLDVLARAGVNVIWLDNNSSSKGVADRVAYKDYRNSSLNPVCDEECRDVGMLAHLQEYIDSHPKGDILIVLHQMGNHGPAYYKRYPKEFEQFTPVCRTNELAECRSEELNNAYDNAILYTDYFLSETIGLLKRNSEKFETAMFYVSDHGESLGENGIYLHGMPNFMAPDNQRHVPAILWFGDSYREASAAGMLKKRDRHYTQDSVFHTLLGMMEVQSRVYDKKLDILHP